MSSAAVDTVNAWQTNANELGKMTFQRFVIRTDAYGLYVKNNVPPFDYSPGPNNTTAKPHSSDELRRVLNHHFRGIQTAGLHSQTADSQCRWFGIDLDCKEWYPEREERAQRNLFYAMTLAEKLRKMGFYVIVEASNGIGGYHVWVLLDDFVPQAWVYYFLQTLISDAEDCGFGKFIDSNGDEQTDLPETFPKQPDCKGKFGNWLRLPGRHHRLTEHWSRFVVEGELISVDDSVQAWIDFNASDHKLIPEYIAPEIPKPEPHKITATASTGVKGCREAAQQHVESMPWPELLTSFRWTDCGGGMWRRPGKPSGGHSAQLNDVGLHVYSQAVADLDGDETYGKWRFYVCSSGFSMEGSGQVEAARHLLGREQADAIDKESQRAFAEQNGTSQPAVNLTGILSSSELTNEVDEVWIVFNAVDEAELQAAGAVVVRAPASGKESFTDWSTLGWRRVHIIDGGNPKPAANVFSLVSHYAKESTIEIHPLLTSGEFSGKTLTTWFAENCPDDDKLQALRDIPFHRSDYATKSVDDIETEQGLRQKAIDSRTFAGKSAAEIWELADQPVQWLVDDVFSCDQPTIFGAKQKSLKTTLLTDLAVSLASGFPWLGKFNIPKRRRILFVTGEASEASAIRKVRRAAECRNLRREDFTDSLRIEAITFPTLPSSEDCHAVGDAVKKYGIEVVLLDPLYMGLQGLNTANLTEVGPAMRQFMAACRPANVIIAHHVKKTASFDDAPNLEDLSQAGIAEFAGNYWLMGRMSEYTGDGLHQLAIRYGGRDEQFGLLKLDFHERSWKAEFTSLMDHREDLKQRRETERVNAMTTRIEKELGRITDGMSEYKLAVAVGTQKDRGPFQDALNELQDRGRIVLIADFKAERSRTTSRGWKLAAG